MNKPISALSPQFSHPLDARSPDLQILFEQLAKGESTRERERSLPFEAIDLIRRARFEALRIPACDGGGSSIRAAAGQGLLLMRRQPLP